MKKPDDLIRAQGILIGVICWQAPSCTQINAIVDFAADDAGALEAAALESEAGTFGS